MGPVDLTVADLERSLDYYRRVDRARACSTKAAVRRGSVQARPSCLQSRRGARRAAGRRLQRPLPLRAAPAGARRPRRLARARRPRGRSADRSVRPLRQRGALPSRPGPPRDRDLRRPPTRAVGGQVERMGSLAARPRTTCSRRVPIRTALSSSGLPAGTTMGHVHLRVADVDETVALLSRPARLRPDGPARAAGGVPERGRLPPPPRREHLGEPRCGSGARRGRPGCARSRSCCPTRRRSPRRRPGSAAAKSQDPSGNRLLLATA